MKTFKINCMHSVHIDDYKKGELEMVNSYGTEAEIIAENTKDAIQTFFETVLFYRFDYSLSWVDEDSNALHYSNLVDTDNVEASKNEIEQWKKGKITLYTNNTYIKVHEVNEVKIPSLNSNN